MVKQTNTTNETNSFVIQEKYGIHEGHYGVWEKTKSGASAFVPKGNAVYVSKIIKRIDTGEQYLSLFFYDSHGEKVSHVFARKELTEQGVMGLVTYGVQILKSDCKILISSLMNQEPTAPLELQHEKLGFTYYERKCIFLAKKAIGVDSKYKGKFKIGKTGNFDVWKQMIQDEVIGYIPLEFILSVSGSGVVTDFLRDKVHVENVIVSLVSDSSKGKTTAGLLMVSAGSKPSFAGDSFVFTLADTVNAIMANIPSSYPVLLDEGSLLKFNPTSLLYNISTGKEKERLTKELNKADSSYFSNCIVITSERGLLSVADENSGLLVRILEVENVTWTKSAQSADNIKSVTSSNYGWLVPKLAKYILSLSESDVVSMYWRWHKQLVQSAEDKGIYNNLTERACKQYALIMLSAELIQEVLGIELHLDDIVSFIQEHSPVSENTQVDIGERALIYLMQYLTKYYSQFIWSEDGDTFVPSKCLGRIKKSRRKRLGNGTVSEERLLITEETLQNILWEGKFPDMKVILKRWKELGYLQCEKDRYLSDIVIVNKKSVKGYIVCLPLKEENQETGEI